MVAGVSICRFWGVGGRRNKGKREIATAFGFAMTKDA